MHASRNVPYYKKLFREIDFNPNIKCLDDITQIPVLSKEKIRSQKNEILAVNANKFEPAPKSTGGSTGKPLSFFTSRSSRGAGGADLLRHYTWSGLKLGEKHAFLWGAERDDPLKSLSGRLHSWAFRYLWLNSFHLTPSKMKRFAKRLIEYEPKILVGYASSLFQFASWLSKKGFQIPLRGVQSSAEKLFGWQRDEISKQFDCDVFDRYGCREVGNIAHECEEHNGLHISEELMLVEILRDGEPAGYGEEGVVVITSYTNYAFPLIRYRLGDRAELLDPSEDCPCGRSLARISTNVGRISDNFYFRNGLVVHGEYFTHLFYDMDSVSQFQVIQESMSKITVRMVPKSDPDEVPIEKIREEITSWINQPVEVNFEFLREIEPTSTGKHRFTISEVRPKNLEMG